MPQINVGEWSRLLNSGQDTPRPRVQPIDPMSFYQMMIQLREKEEAKRESDLSTLLQAAQHGDPKIVTDIATALRVDSSLVPVGVDFAKTIRAKEKEKEEKVLAEQQRLERMQTIGPLAQGFGATLAQPGVNREAEEAKALQALSALPGQTPETLRAEQEQLRALAYAEETTRRAGERTQIRMAREQEAIQESSIRNREMIDDWSTRIAGQAQNLIPEQDIYAEIRAYAGPNRAPALIAQVDNAAKSKIVAMKIQEESPAGRTDFDREVKAWVDLYGYSEPEATLHAKGRVFDDPVTGKVLPKVTADYQQSRYALNELIASIEPLRNAAESAAKAGVERGAMIGPVVGAPAFQDLSRFFSIQDPAVAEYDLEYKNFISRMLKSMQGSRPSDFDLRFYLGLAPMLTELTMTPDGKLNPAAVKRLDTLESILARSAMTPFDKKLGEKAAKLKSIEWSPEDRRVRVASKKYAAGKISISEFTSEINTWKEKRGHLFVPDSVRGAPATDSAVDLYLSGP